MQTKIPLSQPAKEVSVSIIMASYNKEKFIDETIRSVLDQTYQNFELIIVDDHSTDSTVEKIKHYSNKNSRIVFFENSQNKGANYCRNFGLSKAKGDYVMFLDADDILASNCIQKRLAFASNHKDLNLMAFTMGVFSKKIGDDNRKWLPVSKQPLTDFLSHNLPWSILQPLWRRDFLLNLGGFDEAFSRLQDVELHTRALLHPNIKLELISSDPDCYYRISDERKNFIPAVFMERWITAAMQYCIKFQNLVPLNKKKYLTGTIYQTYLQLVYYYKLKDINKLEFETLEKLLLQNSVLRQRNRVIQLLFNFSKKYNLLPIRVPGINKLIKTIIML